MTTDLTLLDDIVQIDAVRLHVTASDVSLDNPDRRANQERPLRRALVHDFGDRLTLNYGGDYPGGIFLCGDVQVGSSEQGQPIPGMHKGGGLHPPLPEIDWAGQLRDIQAPYHVVELLRTLVAAVLQLEEKLNSLTATPPG
jgi:hypothetical protein